MRYELHANGEVYCNEDLGIIKDIIKTLPDDWVLYEIYPSKMCFVEQDPEPLLIKQPRQDRPRPPIEYFRLLPYARAFKACCWYEQGVAKTTIAKRLYCSLAQLTRSMSWYDQTNSVVEYEAYDPTKKNLTELK